ncbi:hypothetical protein KAR91_68180 [Candidatus Pacearchaeota archaeon]|nr:hypothetical protein [Candidatus Pacearchaeota archaeon]
MADEEIKVVLTGKEEGFCKAMAINSTNGMTQRDCYIKFYNTDNMQDDSIDVAASNLAKLSKISIRINELKVEYKDFLNYGVKEHFDELERQKEIAEGRNPDVDIQFPSPTTSLRAVELKGKLVGLDKEKSSTDGIKIDTIQVLINKRLEIDD